MLVSSFLERLEMFSVCRRNILHFILDFSKAFKYVTPKVFASYGADINLQCVSPDSVPLVTLSWQKDGQYLTNYKNSSIVLGNRLSSTLQLTNFTYKDIGLYRCCAENEMFPRFIVRSENIPVQIKGE